VNPTSAVQKKTAVTAAVDIGSNGPNDCRR